MRSPVQKKRRAAAALVLVLSLPVTAGCDAFGSRAPDPLWELTGLEAPESALPDPAAKLIYVSNVNGNPTDKDGNGYISTVSLGGKMINQKWVTGLDAPKGLALAGGKLYASDIDKLVEIDPNTATVTARYEAPGAKFLNDTAAAPDGTVYVSDMATNTIWRLSGGKFVAWLQSDALGNPNGIHVDGGTLVVASWGPMTDTTTIAGHLLAVTIADKNIKPIGTGKPIGHLDGLEPLGPNAFLVSDWVSGKVYKIARTGETSELMGLGQGTADLGYDPASKTAYIPQMKEGKLRAFGISAD